MTPPMNGQPTPDSAALERAQDLIIARATLGLSAAEAEELHDLLETIGPDEARSLESAVEATRSVLLSVAADPAMPSGLTDRLASFGPEPARPLTIRRASPLPWLAAAAAILLAATVFFVLRPSPVSVTQTVAEIDRHADTVRWPFKPGVPAYEKASGEVVWSESLQRGYMRLKGVAANDPTARQYQLWIVDPTRDTHPVDGGVFNIASTGEVIVPFEARLNVHAAAAFAITSEKPGGVVVSAGPLLIVAARP